MARRPQPLRLLIVTPRYLPEIGGVEQHVYETSRRLARLGIDVTVLTTDRTGALPANETIDGVRVRRVRARPRNRDYHLAPAIWRQITTGDYDLVHVQSYHTLVAPLAMLAACRARIPYVLTFHGGGHSSRLRTAARPLQLAALRPLLARAERLIAVARFEVGLLSARLRVPRDRFALVPNGVDERIAAAASRPDDGEPLVVSIGRLERYKGHQRLLAALPMIRASRPSVRVRVAGAGPYGRTLAELARELDVADRVEIASVAAGDRAAMADLIARASLVVLLSEYETHPLAVLEAVAQGRPVLVAETSGLRDLVEDGLAAGVAADASPPTIAAAVLEQLACPFVPRQVALATWDDCAAALLAVYTSVLEERACAS